MKQVITGIIRSENLTAIVNFLKRDKRIILTLLTGTIFVDSFFIKTSSDFVIFGVLLFYIFFAKIIQIKSNSTFLLCLGLVGAMFVSYLFTEASIATEKASVWLVLFMAVGIYQKWRE